MIDKTLMESRADTAIKIVGNKVTDASGKQVRLVGVNCAGLEWAADGDRIMDRVILAFDGWKANIVRLPTSQDRWFGYGPEQEGERDGEDYRGGENYRALCDGIINAAAERGKYILFELHWSNGGRWGAPSRQYRMPDAGSLAFWHDAATRYANHPSVLFGPYNEPFRIPWDIWQSGGWLQNEKEAFAAVGMQSIINTIRAAGALNALVIGGVDWAYDLRGVEEYPLYDKTGAGIIYDTHIYPWKPIPYDQYIPPSVAAKYPILVGECGHYGPKERVAEGPQRLPYAEWVPEFLDYVEDRGFHITAWCFHPKAGPCLISDYDGTPTVQWGAYFKEYCLKKNGEK